MHAAAVIQSEVEGRVEAAFAEAEARRRSPRTNLAVSIGALLFALALVWPVTAHFLGPPGRAGPVLVGVAWLAFELACLAFHGRGPASAVYRFASGLDELAQTGALLGLVYLAGELTAALLVLLVAQSFAWLPSPPARARRSAALRGVAYVALAGVFAACGNVTQSIVAVLVLLTVVFIRRLTGHPLLEGLRVRSERDVLERIWRHEQVNRERDRIARELHDGIGADVTALILRHKRRGEHDAASATLAKRAQRVLDDLRGVIWTLRHEGATLGDLRRLVDARCRKVASPAVLRVSIAADQAGLHVEPELALSALDAAHDLVATEVEVARGRGPRAIVLEISMADVLWISLARNGEPARRVRVSAAARAPLPADR